MSVATIHAVLRRRAIADDRLGLCLGGGGPDDDDAYWASPPRLYDFSQHQHQHQHQNQLKDEPAQEHPLPTPPPSPKPQPPPAPSPPSPSPAPPAPAPAPSPPSPPTPSDAHLCLLALQGTGVSWGVRKRVRFVGRRRADPVPVRAPAPVAHTPIAAARADEESSSNVKAEPKAEAGADGSGEAEGEERKEELEATVAAEKRKRRRRKSGCSRGFTLGRPRKRARRERKPPAPKVVEVVDALEPVAAAPPRAVADRSVAQVYAATEAHAEDERKVAVKTERSKRKDGRARGVAAKRPSKALPKKEEGADESGRDERKVAVKTDGKRKREDGRDERGVTAKRPRKALPKKEPAESDKDMRKAVVVKTETKSRRPDDDEESERAERKAVVVKTERTSSRRKAEAKPAPDNKLVKAEEPGGKGQRAMVDRWTAQRYFAAEAALLTTVRSMGARAGKPVQRRQLREEARKRIGDTGLLDHLLKHTKDKVAPGGGAERLRRRHNADGAMEYWLEPAGLAALRRQAGVADPYWVPPPGWKLGDPVSPDACALAMKRQVEELAAELARVKRHMEQLMKANQGTLCNEVKSETLKTYVSHKPYKEKYACLEKANGNLEKKVLSLEEKYASVAQANGKLEEEVLLLKEKYEAVVEKNTALEGQMNALTNSFLSLKDDLLFLNDEGEQHLQLMGPEHAEHLYLCAKECPETEKQESNAGGEAPDDAAAALAVVGAGEHLVDAAGDGTTTSSGGGCGKRRSRKCSVRISRPQGAFQWPDATPVTPTAGMEEAEDVMDGGLELPPTPPSESSTNASSSAKLLLLPAPESPVQPPPPPPPSATCGSPRDVDIQAAAQPHPGGPELQLRHTAQDPSPSLPLPCGATAVVGTELALATPSY